MTSEQVRDRLHDVRMELTRHLVEALKAHDEPGALFIIDARRRVNAQIERLLLAELTSSLAEIQGCVDALSRATKDLEALEARSDQIAKVIDIADKVVTISAKLAIKLVGG